VAYVAQQAWIQNLSVRDNILFGKPMDPHKYRNTTEACELKEDFQILPAGDLTEIGERVMSFRHLCYFVMQFCVFLFVPLGL